MSAVSSFARFVMFTTVELVKQTIFSGGKFSNKLFRLHGEIDFRIKHGVVVLEESCSRTESGKATAV